MPFRAEGVGSSRVTTYTMFLILSDGNQNRNTPGVLALSTLPSNTSNLQTELGSFTF